MFSVSSGSTYKRDPNLKYGDNIMIGGGYSSDSQQITPQACYNATGAASGQQAVLQLSVAQSFTDVQKELNIDISSKAGFGMFSASAEATYMRSIEDKDYSLSLNYYSYMYDTVSVQLAGGGIDAIKESWQGFYNEGTNPYFGLGCGDNYISSYKEGALLIMGININFVSHLDKEQFTASEGISFGDLISASAHIAQAASQYNIQGSVSMQAYQIGGDPSRLANILTSDPDGNYYSLSCSIQAMDDCVKVADGLLDYARNDFANQISFLNNTGLTSLGRGFITYTPIDYIGLTLPPSLVNQTIIDDRNFLTQSLLENQYYQQKFDELLNGYPVEWYTDSNIYISSQVLYAKAQNNVAVLLSSSVPDQGGLGCYNQPDQCNFITQNIKANLQPITAHDLSYLNGFEGMQYNYEIPDIGAYIYKCGDVGGKQWCVYPSQITMVSPLGDTTRSLVKFDSYYFDSNYLDFVAEVTYLPQGKPNPVVFSYKGNSTDDGNWGNYTGPLVTPWGLYPWPITYSASISPFYFEPYNNSLTTAGELNNYESLE